MILLFLLSTIHIALAYTWAFITDRAQTGIYELFSLDNPLPVLYGPDDPAIVRRLGILIKIRYTLAKRHNCLSMLRDMGGPIGDQSFSLLSPMLARSASGKKIAKEIYGFDSYYGIAPTLIIVRVGLGVSTEDVDKSTLGGTTDQRGAITTMEFQVRAMGEEFRESLSDPKVG
ncbi:hypothetical protein DFH08DRAFT_813667 [Mycena albidolilacea]|uniref:Uncharacterized protein n=1 Tax=Mycena albidolilacea TaxID=1033008 RepID=A0AAD6ZRA5_9AGAR|nr:hypothetical protein DFH08DRAFT_813667 [Mycena albidolilacea]